MYPPGLKSIWWVVCPAICGNHSTNQRWENGKNLVERDQKLIIPAESHDECNHQVWGQSHEHSVQKCMETALTIQAFSAPSHYLNQWWLLVNRTLRNKPYWNMDQNTVIFLHEHALENMCNTDVGHIVFTSTCSLVLCHIQGCQPLVTHLTHWGRDKITAISQTTHSNTFSCMKMFEFQLKFHWSLFLSLQLTIFQHWLR